MEIKRKKFQGVLNILSFNRHFYIAGLSIVVSLFASYFILDWSKLIFGIIIVAFTYGLVMPLLVSAYIYDFSGYYNFEWLNKINLTDSNTTKIININAGFDETSYIIKQKLPQSNLKVYDFYNSKKHTEQAIVRARKVSLVYPKTQQINTNLIPLKDQSVDVIFLLSAAHEIRSNKERDEFLKECSRICKPKGRVIMVEHLRDLPNFLAFSIGFTHFFSQKTWINSFKNAGFKSIKENKFTPFMSVFNCKF